jgi:hypothetical protein
MVCTFLLRSHTATPPPQPNGKPRSVGPRETCIHCANEFPVDRRCPLPDGSLLDGHRASSLFAGCFPPRGAAPVPAGRFYMLADAQRRAPPWNTLCANDPVRNTLYSHELHKTLRALTRGVAFHAPCTCHPTVRPPKGPVSKLATRPSGAPIRDTRRRSATLRAQPARERTTIFRHPWTRAEIPFGAQPVPHSRD